ncbi:MAG: hypothetical protein WC794_00845 [Candidatus Doudnabacteria bacterium]|jgi:hypothetical protein
MSSNLKQQAGIIAFSTLLAGFSLASILNFTDPFSATITTFCFFYLSLFLLSLGSFTLLGLLIRKWLPGELYVNNLGNSFRQALLISLLIVASFFLLSKNLLFWWVEASLILFLAFLEAFLNLKI